jgi:acetyl esterase/lipase
MVSWVFLGMAIVCGLFTLVSFRPPRRPGWLMVPGFFMAWMATELAPFHLLWQLVAVVCFVWFGALESWVGWLALAMTVVSWVGLFFSVRRSLGTDVVFNTALDDAAIERIDTGKTPRRVPLGRVLFPFRFKYRGVKRTKNISYVDDGSMRHMLDVYARKDVEPGAPVLLQIHGGAWMISNKNQQGMPLMYSLAADGWVCVAINYALSPKGTWPDHLVDCKRALAWVREHVAEHGGDPNYVVASGGSAGGHLTAMMGLTANDPAFQPGFEDVDTTIQAMVPFYGVYDWTAAVTSRDRGLRDALQRFIVKRKFADAPEVYEQASPIKRIHADAPPACIVHGTLDTLAPVSEARAFAAKLREVSHNPVVYVELRGAQHAFEIYNSIRSMQAIAGVRSFLRYLLNSSRPAAISLGAASPTYDAPVESGASDQRSTVRTEP